MAEGLKLKVSEAKYKETINKLDGYQKQMQTKLDQLIRRKEQIQKAYTGPEATKAIETIKVNEDNMQKAIAEVEANRKAIQDALDKMDAASATAQKSYEEARAKAEQVWKNS